MALAKKAPPASQSKTKPELTGERPRTFCSQSGSANNIPNSPIEMIPAAMDPFLNEVIEKLDFDGGLILRVHTDWHGINCYGFAPAESVIFL